MFRWRPQKHWPTMSCGKERAKRSVSNSKTRQKEKERLHDRGLETKDWHFGEFTFTPFDFAVVLNSAERTAF